MARYVDAIDLPLPIEEAFDYLADFSRTAEWDPGVVEARRITPGPVRVGTRFRVVVSILGTRIPLEYRITEMERPSRLVLTGGNASVDSVDEVTFVARPGGTRVSYEARLELLGLRRIAEPLLDLTLPHIGRLAVRGLRERLAGEPSQGEVSEIDSRGRRSAARARGRRSASTREGVAS
jgi:dehydrogenase/reductase SDR family protein 12